MDRFITRPTFSSLTIVDRIFQILIGRDLNIR